MNKPLDLTKPLQTRDGRPAKFLHKLDNDRHAGKLVFVIGNKGHEYVVVTNESGNFGEIEAPDGVINVPVKHVREYWVNLYADAPAIQNEIALHRSKEAADRAGPMYRIACKKITIEFYDGEGLDGFKEPNQERWDEVVKK